MRATRILRAQSFVVDESLTRWLSDDIYITKVGKIFKLIPGEPINRCICILPQHAMQLSDILMKSFQQEIKEAIYVSNDSFRHWLELGSVQRLYQTTTGGRDFFYFAKAKDIDEPHDKIIGCASLTFESKYNHYGVWISNVCVDPDFRGKKIATHLTKFIIDDLNHTNTNLHLTVWKKSPSFEWSSAMYQKLGFEFISCVNDQYDLYIRYNKKS